MSSISRLSEKCSKCPDAKKCSNKRMEVCAYLKLPKKLSNNCGARLTSSLMEPAAKPYTPITIKMGEYGDIHTSLEQIHENIMKSFMLNPINENCNSNKS
ncbi:hypothetical protein ACFHWD_14535 [Clostridium sp. MT-14]|uniref:hypothetical protein n=1 Tax=unclassified Clostridium TaxID=2614128 RepID=UPI0012394D71|nr:hypothetical protein [Clostridium sp. HV4-5-A1G]KAA8676193.1 hypothetical protein F3O63_03725 [Clostridium sp. HV4-5-A1G]